MKSLKNFVLLREWPGSTKILALVMCGAFAFVFFLPAFPAFLAGQPHANISLVPHFLALTVVPAWLALFAHYLGALRFKKTSLCATAAAGYLALYLATGYFGLDATGFSAQRYANSVVYFCVQNIQVETCQRWVGVDTTVVNRLPAGLREQVKTKLSQ